MTSRERQLLTRWTIASYVCISGALALVVLLGIWGAYRDLRLVRMTLLLPEVAQLRATAVRTVGHIESALESQADPTDLYEMRDSEWLDAYWRRVIAARPERSYAAIVDGSETVVLHSDRSLEGRSLERRWYERTVSEAGDDVVETRSDVLAGGERAYDIRVPIMVGGTEVGEYHAGFDAAWFDSRVAAAQEDVLRRWIIVISGILLVVVLSVWSLYYLAIRKLALGHAVDIVQLQRVTELGQLAAGLAHEIRNPLHAIRLNAHALGRMLRGIPELDEDDIQAILRETNQEIDRVDRLMQELVGFASPDEPREEDLDVGNEVQSTLTFISEELKRKRVEVETEYPSTPAVVRMDPGRLRQVMLNLLMNATEAVGEGGRVKVVVTPRPGEVEIAVTDDGPGVAESDYQRIFEPFFSTKDGGSGLGLALVKRFVSDAGGEVRCESNGERGATFCITLPARAKSRKRQEKP